MDILYEPAGNGVTHNVDIAEQALRCFGDLTRGQAAALLETWTWRPALSQRERTALLDRFRSAS